MWEFVDKVIYINLDHRQDRRDIMKLFFEKGQIPEDKIVRFPAIK
ncbi:MAG: glycosyl hydrolase family 25, partial [Alphaproteobacteria bacterium]|nr:glycosyl hydrolase family 25 [Alphaproteobacteria bacterium]